MQHESPPRPVTTAPAAIKPVRQTGSRGSSAWSQFGLIHPGPPAFTGVRVFVFAQATDGGERW